MNARYRVWECPWERVKGRIGVRLLFRAFVRLGARAGDRVWARVAFRVWQARRGPL